LDVNEFGWICGWVMECQEKGYLTEAQVGFRLTWGDIKGAARLIQMISHRQGFGNVLAEGVKRAAEKLGSPAKDCAIYTEKGAASVRCGLTPDLERPSTRYGSTPVDGPAKGQAVGEQWEKMVDTWYREVGYDRKTGKPLPATLKALGLDWLAKDLWGKRASRR